MAHKKIKREKDQLSGGVKTETIQAVIGIVLFAVTFFLILSAFNKAGFVGAKIFDFLSYLIGFGFYAVPATFILLTISAFKNLEKRFTLTKWVASICLFLALLGIIDIATDNGGGIVGALISKPLINLFDFYASIAFLLAVVISTTLIILDTHISLSSFAFLTGKTDSEGNGSDITEFEDDRVSTLKKIDTKKAVAPEEDADYVEETALPEVEFIPEPKIAKNVEEDMSSSFKTVGRSYASYQKFIPIPLELLEGDRGKPGVGDIKANSNIIKRTLQNFGINVEMDEISIGPSVTRYALKPAEGVKLSRIVALQNDLSLALAAHPIRIEAPIPGKSLVGIEIPNSIKTTVGLGSLLAVEEYRSSDKALLTSLGKGISGKSHFGNLAKMPHLLIAGATGSGKSVTIHALITSLLYRNSPDNLQFIMIDPKRVELTLYNKIPHLLQPVITDAKKAIGALRWAAKEMERRYNILEAEQVRDIESYHKNILEPELKRLEQKKPADTSDEKMPETMPYIVIIIDELADIMTSFPRELEAAIVRLAQMSRAVGIHLILSTQRPSVNVITGLIKANIPARIALQVASQIDSRTILDMGGAEKLLGAGDMLYLSGEMSKPQRIQSAYITENEVKKVVKFLADAYVDFVRPEINIFDAPSKDVLFESSFEDPKSDDDPLYEKAREEIMSAGKGSTSYLQRRLGVGYSRAAKLIDMLEQRGILSKADGSKPREVIGSPLPPQEDLPS